MSHKTAGVAEKKQPRILGELLDEDPPVARAQDGLVILLRSWHSGSPAWVILEAVAGNAAFASAVLRRFAYTYIMQLCAALYDYVEQRLTLPPCSLANMFWTTQDDETVDAMLLDFYEMDTHCLTHFCRTLRARYPTPSDLLLHGAPFVKSWLATRFCKIGMDEGTHTELRKDVKTNGPGRGITAAANRAFCKEVANEHRHRSGNEPGRKPPPLPLPPPEPPKPTMHMGGNPKLEFTSARRKRVKRLH